ncbi:MAG: PKD domain-containing protein [Chlorobi bacterium]|nr:PKD domain-containing protein [Chlorobiota bacterium]
MYIRRLLTLTLFLGAAGFCYAQPIKGTKNFTHKKVTVKISSLEQVKAESPPPVKVPNKNWKPPLLKVSEDEVIYKEPLGFRTTGIRTFREQSPAPDTTIQGLGDPGNIIPPDVNGAAGPDHLMITLNTEVRIMDKKGNDLFTTSLNNFWSALPGSSATFDPKVLYDPYEQRWMIVTASGSNPVISRLFVGVSATSDPLGEWYMYWIDTDAQNQAWFDYPSIGFNKKWITVSGNMFGGAFYRTVFVIDKPAAYDGEETIPYTRFATTQAFTIVPSITYDSTTEDMYCIATSSGNTGGYGYIKKFRISGETDNPVFEYQGAIGVPDPWDGWAGQNGNFLPQLGSSEKINAVDSRMENVIYRNNKLWAVHHIYVPAGNPVRTDVQWWNLDTSGVILQRGRIRDTTNLFSFAFATIAVNAHEDIMIGHGVFSSSQYAGSGYSFKAYYDDSSSMRSYYQYKDGEAPYYKDFGSGRNRWGDYTATCVDPENDVDFWTIQEYAASPQNTWGTWWAFLKPSFPPVADFTADDTIIPTGEIVNFTDLTAGVPDNWNWTFEGGDPASSVLQNPDSIQYNQEGTYHVGLIASNDLGTDTIVKESYITVSSSILPDVDFRADKEIVCTDETVTFTDLTKYSPIIWDWQFDPSDVTFVEGTSSTSQNPKVVFDKAGSFSVTLTAGT